MDSLMLHRGTVFYGENKTSTSCPMSVKQCVNAMKTNIVGLCVVLCYVQKWFKI